MLFFLCCVQGLHFPSEAGYPFDSRKERFYLMESHYSAGSLDAVVPADLAREFRSQPVLDNSGLRLRVTTMLRPYDAGVLSIGTYPKSLGCVCVCECSRALFCGERLLVCVQIV